MKKTQNFSLDKAGFRLIKFKLLMLFIFSLQYASVAQLITTVDQVVYDMVGNPVRTQGGYLSPWGANEGLPHGVPENWDWYHGARPNSWMTNGENKAISSWGQIFEWAGESPIENVKFQIRNHKMYVFTNARWVLAEDVSANIEAGLFKEADYSWTGLITYQNELKNEGGVSYQIKPNHCLHWFKKVYGNKKRYELPERYDAIFIRFEIRMLPETGESSDISNAKYLVAAGADYYLNPDSQGEDNKPSIAISRHKFLTSEWQIVSAYISGNIPSNVREFKDEILSRPLPPNVVKSLDDN